MKTLQSVFCLAVLCGVVNSTAGEVAFYLRPSIQYTKMTMDDNITSSGKFGVGLAAGITIGTQQRFNPEVEVSTTSGLHAHGTKGYEGYSDSLAESLDLNQYMLSCKFMLFGKDSPVRILLGPTVGWWTARGDENRHTIYSSPAYVLPNVYSSVSESGILWGPVAGILINVNDHAKVELGYRRLAMLGSHGDRNSVYWGGVVGHLTNQVCLGLKYIF